MRPLKSSVMGTRYLMCEISPLSLAGVSGGVRSPARRYPDGPREQLLVGPAGLRFGTKPPTSGPRSRGLVPNRGHADAVGLARLGGRLRGDLRHRPRDSWSALRPESQPAIFSELPGITNGAQSQRSSHDRYVCTAWPQRGQGMSWERCWSLSLTVSHMTPAPFRSPG